MSSPRESAEAMCVCHVGVNTDVVKVDKGNSIHLQFEDKSVNIDDV